jgi:hypothetical protein
MNEERIPVKFLNINVKLKHGRGRQSTGLKKQGMKDIT